LFRKWDTETKILSAVALGLVLVIAGFLANTFLVKVDLIIYVEYDGPSDSGNFSVWIDERKIMDREELNLSIKDLKINKLGHTIKVLEHDRGIHSEKNIKIKDDSLLFITFKDDEYGSGFYITFVDREMIEDMFGEWDPYEKT
jgi:hypothetical protein